jgi:phosphoglycolate phosphatase-like HAD superfamily hydrolase
MVVFDADGTLIGGEETDRESFEAAFEEAAGFELGKAFFAGLLEVTARAIVHQALGGADPERIRSTERAVCRGYLRRLTLAHDRNPACFWAMEGALALLRDLREKGTPVAIATGDWRETISFKLRAAGIPLDGIPMETSSDFYSRAEIISGAVSKAGRTLRETVYVGDGLWDLRACRALGIPFMGVGGRRDQLRAAGAEHILTSLDPAEFWRVKAAIGTPPGAP